MVDRWRTLPLEKSRFKVWLAKCYGSEEIAQGLYFLPVFYRVPPPSPPSLFFVPGAAEEGAGQGCRRGHRRRNHRRRNGEEDGRREGTGLSTVVARAEAVKESRDARARSNWIFFWPATARARRRQPTTVIFACPACVPCSCYTASSKGTCLMYTWRMPFWDVFYFVLSLSALFCHSCLPLSPPARHLPPCPYVICSLRPFPDV